MAQDGLSRAMFGKEKVTSIQSFYDLVDKNMAGEEVGMTSFKGQVLLLVNVASQWGLTKQNYTEFSKIADEYSDRGLKILAFPCNQFGGQEPVSVQPDWYALEEVVTDHVSHLSNLNFHPKGTHEEILSFVDKFEVRDKLTWFEKGDVNGGKCRQVWSFLKRELPNSDGTVDIRWNFAKFLVDHEGKAYKRFSPQASPFTMKEDIEELLKKAEL